MILSLRCVLLKKLALCLACGLVSVAHATSMVVLDVEEQADESHAFVEAIVGPSTVVVTERMVYTDTTLEVTRVVGGEAPKTLVLRQAGGVLPERTVYVPGDARLDEGEHIAAFVRTRNDRWYLTALGQSVWHIDGDRVVRDLDDAHLLERDASGRVVPATGSPQVFDTLEDLAHVVAPLSFGGAL